MPNTIMHHFWGGGGSGAATYCRGSWWVRRWNRLIFHMMMATPAELHLVSHLYSLLPLQALLSVKLCTETLFGGGRRGISTEAIKGGTGNWWKAFCTGQIALSRTVGTSELCRNYATTVERSPGHMVGKVTGRGEKMVLDSQGCLNLNLQRPFLAHTPRISIP